MLQIWKLMYSIKASFEHTNSIESKKWGLIVLSRICV